MAGGQGITRRQFVQRAVGTAAVAAAGGVGIAAFQSAAPKVDALPRFPYLGVKVLKGSKAPQGIPLIPVRVADDGSLEGVPRHLEWYRYCSRNEAPGLFDTYGGDDKLRYLMPEQRKQEAERLGLWWRNKVGRVVRADEFPEVGAGALASWRSEGHLESNLVPVVVIRVDPAAYDEPVNPEYVADGFLAVAGLCAHFCCTPVYRMGDGGYHAGHWDDIVCDCHGSWYDPGTIQQYTFPPTR